MKSLLLLLILVQACVAINTKHLTEEAKKAYKIHQWQTNGDTTLLLPTGTKVAP